MYGNPKTSSNFVYADGITAKQIEESLSAPRKALSEAERISLVKTSKSPTLQNFHPSQKLDVSLYEPIKEIEAVQNSPESEQTRSGCYTTMQKRDWSGEFRIRTRVETSLRIPPLNTGRRINSKLTGRAARKISDSCYFMAKCHDGFKTFVTGTFREDVRARINDGDISIQSQISRTMGALQKMYSRGWTMESSERIAGHDNPLAYCWVVEVPTNKDGSKNPHVHMLLDWQVPKRMFREWAGRIESIWGNGYFKLEKIKNPYAAGVYMAKAAGYLTKAQQSKDQGIVEGNRYGISKTARAPEWTTMMEAELGVMGRLISDFHDDHLEKWGHLFEQRRQTIQSLKECTSEDWARKNYLGHQLKRIRSDIYKIPEITNKYQVLFKDSGSFNHFLGRAMGAGWDHRKRPSSRWLAEFDNKRKQGEREKNAARFKWTDIEWTLALSHYQVYEDAIGEVFPSCDYKQFTLITKGLPKSPLHELEPLQIHD